MTRIDTVRKIDGWPAISIDTLPGALLASVRVKGIKTGRIYHSEIFRPPVRDARACVMLPGFEVGEMVAIAFEAVRPEDLPEAEGPEDADDGLRGGVMGCAAAELRTVLIETMRRQDRAMTVKEIAAILNRDTVDARTRIAMVLVDMEGKGLVKRGSYVPSQSPGRKSVTTWVVVA